MFAYTSGHWALLAVGIVVLWTVAALVVAAVHHRVKSGQWRPYTDEEVR